MRSLLISGVSTLAVASIAVAPVRVMPEAPVAQSSAPVHLTAAVAPLTQKDFVSARADITQVAAELDLSLAAADVTVQNSASDFVTWIYEDIITWTNYLALELAPYVLQFLPAGWLITNQIYAIYPPIIDFTDSVVFDLINPVLNDPLNLQVWANGIGAVAYTGVASLINVGINEINLVIDYFLSWLPPLPPLPPWPPFSVAAADTAAQTAAPADLGLAQVLRDVLGPLGSLLPAATLDSGAPATDLVTPESTEEGVDAGAQKLAAGEQTDVPSEDSLPVAPEPADPESITDSDSDDPTVSEETTEPEDTTESNDTTESEDTEETEKTDESDEPAGSGGTTRPATTRPATTRPATTERDDADDRDTAESEGSQGTDKDAKADKSPARDAKTSDSSASSDA